MEATMLDGGNPRFSMIFPLNPTKPLRVGSAGKKISAISRRQNLWPMLDPWSPVILSYQNPTGVSSRGWILRSTLNGYFSTLHYVQYFAVNGGNVLTTYTINAYVLQFPPLCKHLLTFYFLQHLNTIKHTIKMAIYSEFSH